MMLRGYIAFPRIWHERAQGAKVSATELQDCVGPGRSQNDAYCCDVYDLYCLSGVAPDMDYP